MQRQSRPVVYLLAFTALAIGLVFRWLLDPWLGSMVPLAPVFGAVAIAAWLGGAPPAIVVSVIGFLAADWLFISPRGALDIGDASRIAVIAVYAFSTILIIGLAEVMHVTRRRAYAQRQASLERQARLEVEVAVQKEREAALSESERRFRTLADAAPIMIWLTDGLGACTWVNKPWLDFTGRPIEAEIGSGWMDNIHAEERDGCLDLYRTAISEKKPLRMEYRLRRHDGEYRWIMDQGIPQFDEAGEFKGFIGTCLDITDRRESEQKLKQADRQKDEFLATLAHELRSPLAPIRSAIEILQLGDVDIGMRDKAQDIIDRQVGHMTRLVDDLLDVSRISRGKITLRRERVTLQAVIRDAVDSVQPLIEQLGHRFTAELPAEPIVLNGDPTRLAQIFSNLLNNAVKYTQPGGEIRLRAEQADHSVVVRIRDSGIGIAPEHLPHMFMTYTQLNPALEHSRGGLGIGLWLARQLVLLHNGEVNVHSEGTGKGSEFSVRLPAERAAGSSVQGSAANGSTQQYGGFRILVVEDHEDSADTLATLLTYFGNEVRVARDGVEGVETASAFQPDVILLDVGLPRLNGYEAARLIRQQPWSSRSFMVALTGWGQDKDKEDAEAAGFDHHITKPVDRRGLQSLLEQARAVAAART